MHLPTNTELAREVECEIEAAMVLMGSAMRAVRKGKLESAEFLLDEACERLGESAVQDLRRIKNAPVPRSSGFGNPALTI